MSNIPMNDHKIFKNLLSQHKICDFCLGRIDGKKEGVEQYYSLGTKIREMNSGNILSNSIQSSPANLHNDARKTVRK